MVIAQSVWLPLSKLDRLIDLEAQIGTRLAELKLQCDIPEVTDVVLFVLTEPQLDEAIFVREKWLHDTAQVYTA